MRFGEDIPISIRILDKSCKKYLQCFESGNVSIDYYFSEQAINDKAAVTYLFVDEEMDKLVACMTLSCSAIIIEANSEMKLSTTLMPAVEIQFFAVDEEYQHLPYVKRSSRTLSYYLFSYMIEEIREVSKTVIGAEKIVLYSVPKAESFYKRLKFVPFGNSMYGDQGTYISGCIPMYYDL